MIKAENLIGFAPEQYGIRKAKASDIQSFNTRLFYDLIIQNRIPEKIIFADLVFN